MRPLLHFTLVLLLICPAGAVAQGSYGIAGPVANRLTVRTPLTSNLDPQWRLGQPLAPDSLPRDIPPTHWKEGALIGGLSVGVGLAVLADGLCSSDSGGSCGGAATGGFLLGGLIGGVTGALIGGQFPKESEP